MAIIRWQPPHPARDLIRMQNEIDGLFESVFGPSPARGPDTGFAPAVDVEETAEEFVLRADLPGVDQKDVKVSLHGDTLSIRGGRNLERERNEKGMHRIERFSGAFERTFSLGLPVRADKVRAVVKDGVLEVRVPKAEEARTREIEVQVAHS